MTKKANYSGLQRVTDPHLKQVLKLMHDRLAAVEDAAGADPLAAPLSASLDGGNQRITSLSDPLDDKDAVNRGWLVRFIESRIADERRRMLRGAPDSPATGGGGSGGGTAPGTDDGGAGASGCSQAGSTGHLTPGFPLDSVSVGKIICGTADEFPSLTAPTVDQATRDTNQDELLNRIIWHLLNGGFEAGKQRNPSGVVSGDKITVKVGTNWLAYDVFQGVDYTNPMVTHVIQVFPADHVASGGIAD